MNKNSHSEILLAHCVTPMLLETEDKATIERVSNRAGAVVQINFAYFNHAKVNFELMPDPSACSKTFLTCSHFFDHVQYCLNAVKYF